MDSFAPFICLCRFNGTDKPPSTLCFSPVDDKNNEKTAKNTNLICLHLTCSDMFVCIFFKQDRMSDQMTCSSSTWFNQGLTFPKVYGKWKCLLSLVKHQASSIPDWDPHMDSIQLKSTPTQGWNYSRKSARAFLGIWHVVNNTNTVMD